MNMCGHYLTNTYLKTFRASLCRCIGIAGCLCYNQESFTRFLGKIWVILIKSCGKAQNSPNPSTQGQYVTILVVDFHDLDKCSNLYEYHSHYQIESYLSHSLIIHPPPPEPNLLTIKCRLTIKHVVQSLMNMPF